MTRPDARLVELLQVVVVEGTGVEPDPKRQVVYYFRPDGSLAARYDKWEEEAREVSG